MDLLSCQALTKTYSSGDSAVHAVSQVDLTFRGGEFVAITGPSGSGKSTLLHMLGGLEYPTSGKVLYQGTDLYSYNDNQLAVLRRRRFGFVFQAYNLVRELTGYENILLHRRPSRSPARGNVRWPTATHIAGTRAGQQAVSAVCRRTYRQS